MSRLFLSHASADNAAAIALGRWLAEQGYTDVFLDIDPAAGLLPGDRWMDALKAAADRCEAVLCLVSTAWLGSKWCLAEFLLAKSLHKRIFGLIIEPVPFERLPPEMTAEWQLCELIGPDRFREFHVEDHTVAFREAGLDRLRRGLERAGLDARGFPWPPQNEPDRAPYRGLRALEPQDAAIFFGRDAAIIRGMDQIRGMAELGVEKLLVVLGASGAGKSSFLRAGLLPRLVRDDAHFLPLPVIRPQDAVMSGSTGLAIALSAAFDRFGVIRPPGPVKAQLAADGADALGGMLDDLVVLAEARLGSNEAAAPAPTVILPLDQAEELFNPDGATETAAFLAMLTGVLASARRVLVIATIRTDRYPRLQDDDMLPGVKRALFDLPPMPAAEFKSVIEGPARRSTEAGQRLDIDPGLTELLIAEATGADALPLLGFTLERLWLDYGARGRLTPDDYKAMRGVQGSIEAAVASALAKPDQLPAIPADEAAQRDLLRAAFIPWLARVDPTTGEKMRRSARAEDIPVGSRPVVQRFVAARLLVADRRDHVDVVEVAHESLLRQWPALLAWLDADAANLALVEEIDRAAGEWDRNGRRADWLDHRADRLDAAERLLRREDFRARLGEVGALYVATCRALAERERAMQHAALIRQARLQRRVGWALAAVALVLAVGIAGAWWQRRDNLALQHGLNEQAVTLDAQRHDNLTLKHSLDARQAALDRAGVNLLIEFAASEGARGDPDAAVRLAVHAMRRALALGPAGGLVSLAQTQLASTLGQSDWRLVLSGHRDSVRTAMYSPDGSRVVTASFDRTAIVWDAATGQRLAELRGHDGPVMTAAFSPDGTRVVTASGDGTVRVWDAATGHPIAVYRHKDLLYTAAYSPDGSRIVAASRDGTARVWDTASGQPVLELRGHEGEVYSAVYSPDGERIVTGARDATARVWNAVTGHQIMELRGHEAAVNSAAYSPDGSNIVTASADGTVRIWDAASGKQILKLQGHESVVLSAVYSPDGTHVASASADNTVRVWDASDGHQVNVLRGHENGVTYASYSPDGAQIATASMDWTARIWDAGNQQQVAILRGDTDRVWDAAYSPDGKRVVTASWDNTARIWDAANGKQLISLEGHTSFANAAAYSPDGTRIVTASNDKTARIWDAASGRQLVELQGHRQTVWDAAYSPDGKHIVTASEDTTARVWDAASGQPTAVLTGHDAPVQSAVFSPDGMHIVTASQDRTARIWDAETGQQTSVLRGHENLVFSAAYSPDGTHIVTASADNTIRIWDAATGKQIAVMRGHDAPVWSAAYSPDGRHIVSASWDKTARIWDVASGRQIAVLRGHQQELQHAAYSPDGTRIVTASSDRTAQVWDVHFSSMSPGQLLTEACARRLPGLSRMARLEMDLLGYASDAHEMDVCAGLKQE